MKNQKIPVAIRIDESSLFELKRLKIDLPTLVRATIESAISSNSCPICGSKIKKSAKVTSFKDL
jgi:hypothetical protein